MSEPAELLAAPAPAPAPAPEPTGSSRSDERFSSYFVKRLMVDKGFALELPQELAPLVGKCDFVLARQNMAFEIVLVVDREHDPDARLALTKDEVRAIAESCLHYSGSMNGAKVPVSVMLYEIAAHAPDAQDHERLRAFEHRSFKAKSILHAWHLDRSSGNVWSTMKFNGRFSGLGYLEKVLRSPRISDEELFRSRAAVGGDPNAQPVLTYALLATLTVGFLAELALSRGSIHGMLSPGIGTLVSMGGLQRSLVTGQGEWYRLFTAPLLHGSAIHLVLNGVSLWMAGVVLEHLLGRAWLFALFTLGALGGSLLSLALNPEHLVSIGASGAIMGLLAAAFVSSFRLGEGAERSQIQMGMLQILIPSLLPLAAARTGGQVDYAAHFGGAIVGGIAGVVLLKSWPLDSALPRFGRAARAIALAGAALFATGSALAARNYAHHDAQFDMAALLIPESERPRTDEEAMAKAADLAARFPRDPRSQLFMGMVRTRENDLAGAERHFRAALAEQEILRTQFTGRTLEMLIRAMLIEQLANQGRMDEARTVAAPSCADDPDATRKAALERMGLCGAR